jgi:serine/threonine-protein kinase RsbW
LDSKTKILISSSTINLAKVRGFIEDKAKSAGFDLKIVNQIVLSVDEACTNIIKHTYKFDDSHTIEIGYQYSNKQFVIVLKYKGKPFDPNSQPNPNMKEYFSKYRVGGLGIPLMKKFMDEIKFVHKNPDYNTLTLIKNF